MRVVVLGSGTGIPAKDRTPAGIYVRAGQEHLLFDAGAGTLQRLFRIGVTYQDLDRVFLTHFHPDHCLDLVSILFAMRASQGRRTKPLTVYGPPGVKQLYQRLNQAFNGSIQPRGYRLTIRELGPTSVRLRGCTVSTRLMRHTPGALGYRVEGGGASLAYSGDTDVCEGVVELGQDADLLILECSVPDAMKVTGHLTPSECGRIAAAAAAKHLVLTHVYPVVKDRDAAACARRAYRGRVTLARDLQRLEL